MNSTWRTRITAGLSVIVIAGSGCASQPGVGDKGAQIQNEPAPGAITSVDRYHPGDEKFYDSLRLDGAMLVAPPADVRAATGNADAVVVATITDVKLLRVMSDLQTVGLSLGVSETINGSLQPELMGKIVVEFPLGEPQSAAKQLAELQSSLPQGSAVWFLEWQGNKRPVTKPEVTENTDPADPALYAPLHMHAMFAQGDAAVVKPLGEHGENDKPLPGVQADGERFDKLSSLIGHIRAIGG
ncbi:hypothetical protein ACGFIG_21110 [Micromonospora sp. NPDC049048]|uniref:hypothetical protein n=1 Tax=Micromonospora sp. NPDC049048 TaxID=3364263 RepID=UPI0037167E89